MFCGIKFISESGFIASEKTSNYRTTFKVNSCVLWCVGDENEGKHRKNDADSFF